MSRSYSAHPGPYSHIHGAHPYGTLLIVTIKIVCYHWSPEHLYLKKVKHVIVYNGNPLFGQEQCFGQLQAATPTTARLCSPKLRLPLTGISTPQLICRLCWTAIKFHISAAAPFPQAGFLHKDSDMHMLQSESLYR
jgi:hypothetical protein